MGIFVASFLPGCSSGGDESSDSSGKAAEQPATSQAQETASQDTTTGQESSAKPPADIPPQAGVKATARPDTAAAAVKAPALGDVLARHGDDLRAIHGVLSVDSVACDVGSCIGITVTRRTQSILSQLPASIEGYRVVVKEKRSEH